MTAAPKPAPTSPWIVPPPRARRSLVGDGFERGEMTELEPENDRVFRSISLRRRVAHDRCDPPHSKHRTFLDPRRPTMFHPETAYTLAKERQQQLERDAVEASPILALLARLIRRD